MLKALVVSNKPLTTLEISQLAGISIAQVHGAGLLLLSRRLVLVEKHKQPGHNGGGEVNAQSIWRIRELARGKIDSLLNNTPYIRKDI